MSNSVFRNSEGYYDPTAGAALASVIRQERKAKELAQKNGFRPVVYICSPYAGDVDSNVNAARKYCRFAVDHGYIPFAAHLLFPQFLNDRNPAERNLGIFFGNVFMDKCKEIWVFGSEMSAGMQAEHDRAVRKGYTIRYFNTDCSEKTSAKMEVNDHEKD